MSNLNVDTPSDRVFTKHAMIIIYEHVSRFRNKTVDLILAYRKPLHISFIFLRPAYKWNVSFLKFEIIFKIFNTLRLFYRTHIFNANSIKLNKDMLLNSLSLNIRKSIIKL